MVPRMVVPAGSAEVRTNSLPAAGPVPRAVAWGVDLVVRVGMMFAAVMVLGTLGKFGGGLSLIAAFLLQWGYMIVLEALWHGQTLGKRAMRLRVVLANGAPIGWPAAITRNLLRVVDTAEEALAALGEAIRGDDEGPAAGEHRTSAEDEVVDAS